MDITNNYNQYSAASFSGVKKENPNKMNKDEKMKLLIDKGFKLLHDKAEREVPENGPFASKVFMAFDVPDSQNEALMVIEHDKIDPKTQRRLSVKLHRPNSDRYESHYMFKGTKQEILDYLNKAENQPDFINSVNELSKSVDDYYSSL